MKRLLTVAFRSSSPLTVRTGVEELQELLPKLCEWTFTLPGNAWVHTIAQDLTRASVARTSMRLKYHAGQPATDTKLDIGSRRPFLIINADHNQPVQAEKHRTQRSLQSPTPQRPQFSPVGSGNIDTRQRLQRAVDVEGEHPRQVAVGLRRNSNEQAARSLQQDSSGDTETSLQRNSRRRVTGPRAFSFLLTIQEATPLNKTTRQHRVIGCIRVCDAAPRTPRPLVKARVSRSWRPALLGPWPSPR